MCGIVGSINFRLKHDIINHVMGHRGPDAQNEYSYKNVHFYHLRLAIQDISGGAQPKHLDEKYSIIFNGQIYNHLELRNLYNIECQSLSDCETILHLYHRFGIEFLSKVDGMFVFVILDKSINQLIIARDRAGKKPFYYFNDGEKFVFASELNCLKSQLVLEIDESSIPHYLRLGSLYKSQTPYKNVLELEGGTFMKVDLNSLDMQKVRWWDIHTYYLRESQDDFATSLEKVEYQLDQAIQRRVNSSDLEVGAFLSGGIDSGLVTAIASKYNSKLKTFTVSFDGQFNEAPLAKLVAQKYGTDHHELEISFSNLENDIEKIICNYGEPFADSSAIPSYYVCLEAKKHLTVTLNGDGADELFGGYRRYVPFSKYDFFKINPYVRSISTALFNILPTSDNKMSYYNYIYRLISLSSNEGVSLYQSATSDVFEGFDSLLLNDYQAVVNQEYQNEFQRITSSKITGLKKIMNLDFEVILFGDLLVKMDIATMSSSLEGRSPFLSKELLEYAPSIPNEYKIKGTTTKYLLRKLGEKYLPKTLLNQPKRGFEVPLKNWVNNELKDIILEVIRSPKAYHLNFIDNNELNKVLERKIRISEEKRAKILWSLFCLDIWYIHNV